MYQLFLLNLYWSYDTATSCDIIGPSKQEKKALFLVTVYPHSSPLHFSSLPRIWLYHFFVLSVLCVYYCGGINITVAEIVVIVIAVFFLHHISRWRAGIFKYLFMWYFSRFLDTKNTYTHKYTEHSAMYQSWYGFLLI